MSSAPVTNANAFDRFHLSFPSALLIQSAEKMNANDQPWVKSMKILALLTHVGNGVSLLVTQSDIAESIRYAKKRSKRTLYKALDILHKLRFGGPCKPQGFTLQGTVSEALGLNGSL